MRIRLSVLAVVSLAIGFVWPSFADQKDTAGPQIAEQRNLLGNVKALAEFTALRTKYVEALNMLDATAMAGFYSEDGMVVTPGRMVCGSGEHREVVCIHVPAMAAHQFYWPD